MFLPIGTNVSYGCQKMIQMLKSFSIPCDIQVLENPFESLNKEGVPNIGYVMQIENLSLNTVFDDINDCILTTYMYWANYYVQLVKLKNVEVKNEG